MARQVVWTEVAWRDLDHIADYIFEDSPGYARAFVGRIKEQAASHADLSMRGRIVPELGMSNVRELLVGNYRLLYELHERRLYIIGLIHGARDLAALWGREHRGDVEKPS